LDRPIVYTQEQGRSVDFLFAQRATMIGLAKLSQAAFGSNTVVRGLAVTPNSPAALNVLVGIGEIYSMTAVDATSWGSLPADTTDMILKQGLNMTAQTISTPAPTTSGFSIAYLIEAQYQDQDTTTAVLPFFNSSNPQIPLNGQGGSGAPLPTERQGFCVIQAKAGTAATTGTQVTPTVDSGWTALAVVTVANGQSTVTSGNISVPAGVPQVTSLLQMMQTGSPGYAVDTSTTANQIALSLTPTLTAYTDGQEITFKAANTNTGPCTINAGPGSINLVGVAGALQGGEIIAGSQYTALYSASLGELVLNSQTGGAEQINPATKPLHAVQLGQLPSVAGTGYGVRNLIAANNATTPNTQFNISADAATFINPTTGASVCVRNIATITNNLLTAGPAANGRDVAGAFAASTWLHYYLIYNGTTVASIVSANAPPTGPALPAGYTFWSYVGVVYYGSTSALVLVRQRGAWVMYATAQPIVSNGSATTATPVNTTTLTPPNAVEFELAIPNLSAVSSSSGPVSVTLFIQVEASFNAFQMGIQGVGSTSSTWGVAGTAKRFSALSQGFNYFLTVTAGSSQQVTIAVDGYSVPNGGE
jgi:hypothetical protein